MTASGGVKRLALAALSPRGDARSRPSRSRGRGGCGSRRRVPVGQRARADLFGASRGLDSGAAERLAELRRNCAPSGASAARLAREGEVPWFDYRVQFADVFAAGGFDLVVGNPPWVRVRRGAAGAAPAAGWPIPLVARGSAAAGTPIARIWRSRFSSVRSSWPRPGGVVAMLVPAKIAAAGYGTAARHALAASTTVVTAADLTRRSHASFEATVYPLALVLRKAAPPAAPPGAAALGASVTVPQAGLRGGGPWLLGRQSLRGALGEMRHRHPRLDDTVACHLGVKTGANEVFLDPPEVERELLRWAIRGRDVRPFSPASNATAVDHTVARLTAAAPAAARRRVFYPLLGRLRSRADYAGGPPWTVFRARAAAAASSGRLGRPRERSAGGSLTGAARHHPTQQLLRGGASERRGGRSPGRLAQRQPAAGRGAGGRNARGGRLPSLQRGGGWSCAAAGRRAPGCGPLNTRRSRQGG